MSSSSNQSALVRTLACLSLLVFTLSVLAACTGRRGGRARWRTSAQPEAPVPMPDMQEMMGYMMEKNAPGPAQEWLAEMQGEFSATTRFWMEPGQPPMEGTATCKQTLMSGGSILGIEFNGEFMGTPFTGRGMIAHDNVKEQWQQVWCDNVYTGISWATGSQDPETGVITFHSEWDGGKYGKHPTRMTYTRTGPDSFTLESWTNWAGQGEIKEMEIKYTRTGTAGYGAADAGAPPEAPEAPVAPMPGDE